MNCPYTGRKIISPLDFVDARTQEAKNLIACGKLDVNDFRSAIYVDLKDSPSDAECVQCLTSDDQKI